MAVKVPEDYPQPEGGGGLDAVSQRGLAVYESRLKQILEPAHNGETVAIHIESGDFAVAPARGKAMRAARRTHPEGLIVLLSVGSEADHSLADRLLSSGAFGSAVAALVDERVTEL